MPILFAITGSALGSFAEGAILAASVYMVSRGKNNVLRNKKGGTESPRGQSGPGGILLLVILSGL